MSTRDQPTFGMNHPTVIPTNFDRDLDRTTDTDDRSADTDDRLADAGDRSIDAEDERPE